MTRPVNPLSTTPSPSPSVSPTSSSTPPRDLPTLTPSRRRMSLSESPSLTDNCLIWFGLGAAVYVYDESVEDVGLVVGRRGDMAWPGQISASQSIHLCCLVVNDGGSD